MNTLKGTKTEKKKVIKNELPKVEKESKKMDPVTFNLIIWSALLIYVPYKLYKVIDSFADNINPYNFSKRK